MFRAEEWDNFGLITVDSTLAYSIIDVLLGGRRASTAVRIDGRPYSTIETSLVRRMLEVVLADTEQAFEPLSPVNFNIDRLETNPRFASISRPANAAILIQLRIDMEDRGGSIEILLPYATIEPIRELLLQSFMGEKFGRDPIWEDHLATEIWQATRRRRRHPLRDPAAAAADAGPEGRRHADVRRRARLAGASSNAATFCSPRAAWAAWATRSPCASRASCAAPAPPSPPTRPSAAGRKDAK